MTASPVPQGYSTVTPWIISSDTARLLTFLKEGFGAEELARIPDPDGGIGHAEARVGDSVVMLFDARPDWPPTPAFLRVYVPDADALYRTALEAGASSVTEVTTLHFGDRVGRVRDPLGNVWWLQTHVEDVPWGEMNERMNDPKWVEAMAYVEGAEIMPGYSRKDVRPDL